MYENNIIVKHKERNSTKENKDGEFENAISVFFIGSVAIK